MLSCDVHTFGNNETRTTPQEHYLNRQLILSLGVHGLPGASSTPPTFGGGRIHAASLLYGSGSTQMTWGCDPYAYTHWLYRCCVRLDGRHLFQKKQPHLRDKVPGARAGNISQYSKNQQRTLGLVTENPHPPYIRKEAHK